MPDWDCWPSGLRLGLVVFGLGASGWGRGLGRRPMSNDCLRCGLCCFSTLDTYVRVTGEDWARLGDEAERWARFVGNRAYLRMKDGHCAALELRRGVDGAPVYFCTIYERRPRICRELERGSPVCEAERERKEPQRLPAAVG
ncbi:flagellin N-methylase [mine drainage metagenome]|uniref:Flagellin N-methylase n=1 Tax=mine drainage metagenome TaxID=410659 RepID=A0A1J5R1E8_9ZZZZ